ncbi:hypothetical protein OIN60_01445 [Paenibacillus sp. P96]|uniref:Replicative helicase inhibitor G39P N-terminal domain-containing protein n=1 Tax=Paenibacillus zeirhizosphaerae TaxID=2987519 RepID=A0ABT9FLP7_9BACL|nr:hypothetical protein [Paenibacillus sp. P96]MDP4095456.1 hypothetical protein [Paenibacillus sp. P96]
MTLEEVGELFDKIIEFYPAFTGDMSKLQSWHEALKHISFSLAHSNLIKYVADPDNRYAPHPGALAKRPVVTESERYHEGMKKAGAVMLQTSESLREDAVGPTEEQRRKVRELLEQQR